MSVLSGGGVVSSSSSNRSVVVVGRDEPTVYDKRPDNDNFNSRFFINYIFYLCPALCCSNSDYKYTSYFEAKGDTISILRSQSEFRFFVLFAFLQPQSTRLVRIQVDDGANCLFT